MTTRNGGDQLTHGGGDGEVGCGWWWHNKSRAKKKEVSKITLLLLLRKTLGKPNCRWHFSVLFSVWSGLFIRFVPKPSPNNVFLFFPEQATAFKETAAMSSPTDCCQSFSFSSLFFFFKCVSQCLWVPSSSSSSFRVEFAFLFSSFFSWVQCSSSSSQQQAAAWQRIHFSLLLLLLLSLLLSCCC